MNLLTALRRAVPMIGAAPAVDISTLPDVALTPNERAWMTLWYLEGHPDEWNQKSYGLFADASRTATVGCFAHHLCKAAGYEQFGCGVRALPYPNLSFLVDGSCMEGRPCRHADWVKTENGWKPVYRVAAGLLDGDATRLTDTLFRATNSIRQLRRGLPELVGAEPRHRR